MKAKRFTATGMMCPACPKILERKLERIPGVASAEADLRRGTIAVIYDAAATDELTLGEAIYRAGFGLKMDLRGVKITPAA